jgi:hypothetical protein
LPFAEKAKSTIGRFSAFASCSRASKHFWIFCWKSLNSVSVCLCSKAGLKAPDHRLISGAAFFLPLSVSHPCRNDPSFLQTLTVWSSGPKTRIPVAAFFTLWLHRRRPSYRSQQASLSLL